ncbi:MAG TPA: hypothetical protein VJ953_17415 [Saprospiraceae bacterium]|nr:hypothetical protein [Saprospiraceae bacterium]
MKKWLQLFGACLVVFLFILSVKKLKTVLPPMQKISEEIEAQGLESDALFYSESPKAVDAAFRLQRQME